MTVTLQTEALLRQPQFSMRQDEKGAMLLPLLQALTAYHRQHCEAYRRISDLTGPHAMGNFAELPFLPASLFKLRRLQSVADTDVRTVITSSGTSGMQRSQIVLDAETAKLSGKALQAVLGAVIGTERLPMLVIDTPAAITDKTSVGARAAAILGLMPFGKDVTFALREDFSVDHQAVAAFLARHNGKAILGFGFTFLIWQYLVPACEAAGYDFSDMLLLHSGGWKRLQSDAVDNAAFKARLARVAGVCKAINFYGMAELPGTVFVENGDGLLYAPLFADILIRDPVSLAVLPQGQPGLIQIVSTVPHSYPGHSLLTEDIGVIEAVDSGVGGYMGHGFRVLGRAPRAELRGCSDVLAEIS